MMARHRFVDRQRRQFVKRALIEVCCVDHVAAAAERWAAVESAEVV